MPNLLVQDDPLLAELLLENFDLRPLELGNLLLLPVDPAGPRRPVSRLAQVGYVAQVVGAAPTQASGPSFADLGPNTLDFGRVVVQLDVARLVLAANPERCRAGLWITHEGPASHHPTDQTATLGLGLAGVALVSAVLCAAWAGAGVFLGRKYDRTAANTVAAEET